MTLHPEAVAFLQGARDAGGPPLFELSPVEARAMSRGLVDLIGPGPAVEVVEELVIPVSGAEIAGRRYAPREAHGTIVWLHSGGWVLDGLDGADAMCRILANAAGAQVVSVDCRVAPEHPFPTPVDDCFDALRWIAAQATESGPLASRDDPDASPPRTPDLAPAIVVIAEHDPLRDEGLAYAQRLRDAGVPVSLHSCDDMPHAFFSFVNLFATGNEAVARVGAEVREMLAAAP